MGRHYKKTPYSSSTPLANGGQRCSLLQIAASGPCIATDAGLEFPYLPFRCQEEAAEVGMTLPAPCTGMVVESLQMLAACVCAGKTIHPVSSIQQLLSESLPPSSKGGNSLSRPPHHIPRDLKWLTLSPREFPSSTRKGLEYPVLWEFTSQVFC